MARRRSFPFLAWDRVKVRATGRTGTVGVVMQQTDGSDDRVEIQFDGSRSTHLEGGVFRAAELELLSRRDPPGWHPATADPEWCELCREQPCACESEPAEPSSSSGRVVVQPAPSSRLPAAQRQAGFGWAPPPAAPPRPRPTQGALFPSELERPRQRGPRAPQSPGVAPPVEWQSAERSRLDVLLGRRPVQQLEQEPLPLGGLQTQTGFRFGPPQRQQTAPLAAPAAPETRGRYDFSVQRTGKRAPFAYTIGDSVARRVRQLTSDRNTLAAIDRLERFKGSAHDLQLAASLLAASGDAIGAGSLLKTLAPESESPPPPPPRPAPAVPLSEQWSPEQSERRGVFEQADGTFLAMGFSKSRTFKTRARAVAWLNRIAHGWEAKQPRAPEPAPLEQRAARIYAKAVERATTKGRGKRAAWAELRRLVDETRQVLEAHERGLPTVPDPSEPWGQRVDVAAAKRPVVSVLERLERLKPPPRPAAGYERAAWSSVRDAMVNVLRVYLGEGHRAGPFGVEARRHGLWAIGHELKTVDSYERDEEMRRLRS